MLNEPVLLHQHRFLQWDSPILLDAIRFAHWKHTECPHPHEYIRKEVNTPLFMLVWTELKEKGFLVCINNVVERAVIIGDSHRYWIDGVFLNRVAL